MTKDRLDLPPHSVENEECLLGSLLMAPEQLSRVRMFVKPDDFFMLRHGWIYEAMLALADRGDPIDNRTLAEELRASGQLDQVGGEVYLNYLPGIVPTALHSEIYARILQRSAMRRQLLGAAGEISALAYAEDKDIHEVIAEARRVLADATQSHALGGGFVSSKEVAGDLWNGVPDVKKRRVALGLAGLNTPLQGGLQRGGLMYIGARPGMGKSALLLTMAAYIAQHVGPVAYVSLEMKRRANIARLIAAKYEQRLDVVEMQLEFEPADRKSWANEAIAWASGLPLYWSETARTPDQLFNELDQLRADVDLTAVFLDHMNLMRSGDTAIDRHDYARGTYCSRRFKEMNLHFDLPFVAAVQLSRAVEQRADKRPLLSDMRDSGALEEDADVVTMLYRDEYYNPDTERIHELEAIIRKNRQGAVSAAMLLFNPTEMRIRDLHRITAHLDDRNAPPEYAGPVLVGK